MSQDPASGGIPSLLPHEDLAFHFPFRTGVPPSGLRLARRNLSHNPGRILTSEATQERMDNYLRQTLGQPHCYAKAVVSHRPNRLRF